MRKKTTAIAWKGSQKQNTASLFAMLCRAALGMAFLFAAIFGALDGYIHLSVGISLCAAAVFLPVIFCRRDWQRMAVTAAVLAVCAAFALIRNSEVRESTAGLLNHWQRLLSPRLGRILLDFDGGAVSMHGPALLCAVLAAAAGWGFSGNDWFLGALCGVLVLGAAFGIIPALYLAPILLSAALYWASEHGIHWKRAAAGLLVSALVAALCLPFSGSLEAAGEAIGDRAERLIHGILYHRQTTLPEGDLRSFDAFMPQGSPSLELSMEHPQKLYLKSYIGERYTESGWEALEEAEIAGSDSLFYWLHKSGFSADHQLALALEEQGNGVSVSVLGACRGRAYIPYGMETELPSELLSYPDRGAADLGNTYTLSVIPGAMNDIYRRQIDLAGGKGDKEYLTLESAYRAFVYDHYLAIPDATGALLGQLLEEEGGEATLAEIQEKVLRFLDDNLTYDPGVVTRCGDADFLAWLLMSQKSGYSVHYATAAVCLLRYFGVPARYVEGYLVTAEEASQIQPEEPFPVDDSHAHAWAEFYLNGVGWIPFEATPGYRDEEALALQALITDPNSELHDALGESYEQQHFSIPQSVVQQPEDKEEQRSSPVHIPWQLWSSAGAGMALILLAILLWRHFMLCRLLKQLRSSEPRQAIPELYAYSMGLFSAAGCSAEEEWETEAKLNQEALFSEHPMDESQRAVLLELAEKAEAYCRKHCSIRKRAYLRWIRCVYR